jgi:hypothetical protein
VQTSQREQPQDCAITMIGASAQRQNAEMLKVAEIRTCWHDAADMQTICFEMARDVARARVYVKQSICKAVQGTDDVLLLGM